MRLAGVEAIASPRILGELDRHDADLVAALEIDAGRRADEPLDLLDLRLHRLGRGRLRRASPGAACG